MNLFIALLVSRQYLSKERIRASVEGYSGQSDQSFDRMFERDKEELRELGIPVETGSNDKYFGDELGYRIRRDDVELPDVELTREEAAVVGLAAQVWEHAGLATESTTALAKLKAAGVTIDTSVLRMVEPRLAADEPAFDRMWEAVTRRIPVKFDYRRAGAETTTRSVEPWGVISWHGRWYLAGFDRDRDDRRMFRLGRVRGDVVFDGPPGSYTIPAGTDLEALAADLHPTGPARTAVVRVRTGRVQSLRRRAEALRPVDASFDEIEVAFSSVADLAAEIVCYAADAVVVSPAALRDAVIARLRRAVNAQ